MFRKIILMLSLLSLPALAQNYITEDLHTYLRKGPGMEYKLIGKIKAGEPIKILQTQDNFVLIEDSKGRQGWVLNKEITDIASFKSVADKLQKDLNALQEKLKNNDQEWKNRVASMQQRVEEAETTSSTLVGKNSLLNREIDILKSKNLELEALANSNKQNELTTWFLYGGMVLTIGLLFGLILPYIIPRKRRRQFNW